MRATSTADDENSENDDDDDDDEYEDWGWSPSQIERGPVPTSQNSQSKLPVKSLDE